MRPEGNRVVDSVEMYLKGNYEPPLVGIEIKPVSSTKAVYARNNYAVSPAPITQS